ncbi:MAG: phenylalanine--tRNA ligase subunit beta [Oscillospiraceae bacterium]|nr:phenylalanine--tRNA ligase subunit beta [Oscillospiraceae bacterium]
MNLSMKWLSDFYTCDVDIKKFADDMTMSGSKAEGYHTEGEKLSNIIVGKVVSVEKHPDADTLYICRVDMGDETVQIVTGADNVVPGAMVPVAMHKSTLADGKQITRGKLRGVESNGMLCSLSELGLTAHDFPYADENGIFLLEEDCKPGQTIQEAIGLNDTVVEFEITSNRPDCLGVIGLAREAAATLGGKLRLHTPAVKAGGADIHSILKVEVQNSELCMRYAAAAVTGVKVGPSPRWMRERLRACGVRPINNIVDITNYVMLEYGQPMHAFDLRHVKGSQIIVRNAKDGEKIKMLDGVERILSPEMLTIADEEAPSAVAGVMGGEFSGVYADSETVVFESACFDGPAVRMAAKKLGVRTESSGRFEKQLDPENCIPALMRACELVELLGAGIVAAGIIDVDNCDKSSREFHVDFDSINAFLGTDISYKEMVDILNRLGCKVTSSPFRDAEPYVISPPSWRGDLKTQADIAEEIARIYGYNNIPTTSVRGAAEGALTPEQKAVRTMHSTLTAQGFFEISTYSFISPKAYDKIALPENSPLRRSVVISNPLGEDTGVMRTTALPSMMDTLSFNYNNRNTEANLYELATEYIPVKDEDLPQENSVITLGQYGKAASFYTLKGALENLFERMGISAFELKANRENPTFHPGRCADLVIGGEAAGVIGEAHPAVLENYGIGTRAYLARISFDALLKHRRPRETFTSLPRYPASSRDLALVCDEKTEAAALEKCIRRAAGGILEKLELFDVYRGGQIPAGKKSIAYTLLMRAPDRTLTDEECDRAVKKSLGELEKIGVFLRG